MQCLRWCKQMDFQTPDWVCKIMASCISELVDYPYTVLEPTPGEGNLVRAINERYPSSMVYTPKDFFAFNEQVDVVVGNPPFSPMSVGYDILERCFDMSSNVIMLMPWLALINSEKRTRMYRLHGLKKVIHLPRKAFKGSRVQTCIMVFRQGYCGNIELVIQEAG